MSACVFTHCSFVQEIVIEVHKVFLGLFGTEAPEEVSMQVAQLWLDRQNIMLQNNKMNLSFIIKELFEQLRLFMQPFTRHPNVSAFTRNRLI